MVGKSKAMKKRGKVGTVPMETAASPCPDPDVVAIPIENLPDDALRMNVKCGTKIRNVLEYAITHFPRHPAVVWVGRGDGINKTISCAEIFKRKYPGLHQITRIRFAKKMPENTTSNEKSCGGDGGSSKIPEVFVALLRQVEDVNVDGYQAPDDTADHRREPGGDLVEAEESGVVTQIDGPESAMETSGAEKRRKLETEEDEEKSTSQSKVMKTSDS